MTLKISNGPKATIYPYTHDGLLYRLKNSPPKTPKPDPKSATPNPSSNSRARNPDKSIKAQARETPRSSPLIPPDYFSSRV